MTQTVEIPPHGAARDLAILGLSFIAEDIDRLGQFLALSGFGPAELRARAGDPEFLGGVLDFLLSDEAVVVAFAQWAAVDPASVLALRQKLPGGSVE
jgi:hypothetical protein